VSKIARRVALAAGVLVLVPMVQPFPNYLLWLWAGVVWPWRYACVEPGREPEPEPEPRPGPREPSLAGAING